MDPRIQQPQNRRSFFSEQNENMLYGMLVNNFQQKLGAQLNEAQTSRLERGLEFYMSEVFQANASLPVQALNKEVLSATASDFNDYIQRKEVVTQATPQMFQETSQRYEKVQQDRQRSLETPRPSIPDYVQPVLIKEDDSTSALTLFEEAKKRRNLEVTQQAEEQVAKRSASSLQPLYLEETRGPDPRSMYDRPLDLVVAAQRELPGRADVNPTLARPGPAVANRVSLQQDIIIKQEDIQSYKETEYNLSVYSADRSWESDLNNGENRFNFSVNLFSNNSPTGVNLMARAANRFKNIVRIEFVKAILPIEVTDVIVRKLTSTTSPNLTQALMNAEAISITSVNAGVASASIPAANSAQQNFQLLQLKNSLLTTTALSYDTEYSKNIYGYPFITLNINELDTNTYGTSDSMDNAFGILQYDSNWSDNTDSLGFASLIPKHMKCQRIYAPTPLATLNKLSIRLQQPNGELVNSTSDTLDISGIFLSRYSSIRSYFNYGMDLSGSAYADPTGEYIWLDCKKWFSRYQVAVGDRIQIKNLTCSSPSAAVADVMTFLQSSSGLIVVGLAYSKSITANDLISVGLTANQVTAGTLGTIATSVLVDGSNTMGYSRFIILRGKFQDPTTGSTSVSPYGGAFDNSTVSTAMLSGATKIVPGKLINLSRQTQLIFRVITREYDSTSLVRPDNL
jgi:predicted transcriptional regulator